MQENYLSQLRFADLSITSYRKKALQDKGFGVIVPLFKPLSLPITL